MAGITRTRLRGWARVAEAACLLVVTGAAQRWIPMTKWARVLGTAAEVPATWRGQVVGALPAVAANSQEARVASAVRNACLRLSWEPTCLSQAATGQLMLRRRGGAGVVVIGLRPQFGAQWQAHAWLLGKRGALTGGRAADGFTAATIYQFPGGLQALDVEL